MSVNFHISLAPEQQAVAVELQSMLVDLLDLSLIGKHAHWNVEGRMFRSVHQELDCPRTPVLTASCGRGRVAPQKARRGAAPFCPWRGGEPAPYARIDHQ